MIRPMIRVNMFLPQKMWESLKTLADAREVSTAEVARDAFAAELQRAAKSAKAAGSKSEAIGDYQF